MKIEKNKLTIIYIRCIRILRILNYKIFKMIEDFKGIDTLKYVDVEELGFTTESGFRYEHSKKKYLRKVLKDLNISHTDSIIDVGSGKGSALIEFSKYPFSKIVGVELSNLLHVISNNNLIRLKVRNVNLFCMNAIQFADFNEFNYIYFYNPFPPATFKKVLGKIIQANKLTQHFFYIIYKNPTCHEVIMKSNYFEFVKQYKNKNFIFPQLDYINIYKSK